MRTLGHSPTCGNLFDFDLGDNIFFLMSISNADSQCCIFQCLFLMLIFDVDFKSCFLTIISNVFFYYFLFLGLYFFQNILVL